MRLLVSLENYKHFRNEACVRLLLLESSSGIHKNTLHCSLLLIITSYCFCVTADDDNEVEYENCIIRYLKSINKLSSDFHEHKIAKKVKCGNYVKDFQEEIYSLAVTALNGSAHYEYRDCIIIVLKSLGFADLAMQEMMHGKSRKVSNFKKEQIYAPPNEITEITVRSCIQSHIFAKLFNEIFNASKRNHPVTKNCVWKWMIDNNLIYSKLYNVTTSPHKVEVKWQNCREILKKTIEHLKKVVIRKLRRDVWLEDKQIKCAITQYSNHYARFLKITILSELNITEKQKEAEREDFVKFMNSFTDICW